MLVITLFQKVPDNNSLKTLLWHFVGHVGNVCCHYNHDSVYYNRIRLIKANPSFFETVWTQLHSTSLGNWLSVRLRTKWFWVWVQLHSLIQLHVSFRVVNLRQSVTKYYGNFESVFKISPHPLYNVANP